MKISVIIVSYNTSAILHKCLDALFENQTSHDMDVFVVDNNSADDSVEMLKQNFNGRINLIENKVNAGFAAANNQAAEKAFGDYIILLNPDAYIRPGAIDNAVAFMESHPECGLCGGRLVNLKGELDPSARRFPCSIYKLMTLSGLSDKYPDSRIFGRGDFKYFDHNSVMEVDWVPGTFTIYRRSMLVRTGLFDERFYIYYEETDLSLRAKRMGWKIFFIPDAEVIHVGGASAKTRKDEKFDSGGSQLLKFRMRAEYLYFRKNYGRLAVIANAGVEIGWHLMRYIINCRPKNPAGPEKRQASAMFVKTGLMALWDTRMGGKTPPVPW